MPAQKNLRDVYLEELRDLWSANDQMNAVVNDLSPKPKIPGRRRRYRNQPVESLNTQQR